MVIGLKEKIIKKAKRIGIDKIGFTTADPFDYLRESLIEQKKNNHTSGFEHQNIDERLYPELIFDQPKTIISIALAYPSVSKETIPQEKGKRRGSFARASWGRDYHFILKEHMSLLVEYMKEEVPGAKFKSMVDTGELIDVAVAQRAGIGFIGRNGLLITEEYGSWVYLGEIITDIEIEPDEPIENGCGDCMRCVQYCPPSALLADGRMNAKKCLSYQTQAKEYMPEKYRRRMTTVIYGCDICQLVCPYNQGKSYHLHEEMEPKLDREFPVLLDMLDLSNREFKNQFGELAGSWRGRKPLQRNAIIALANSRDETALPKLIQLVENDPRPMIRGTAAWAISRIQKYYNQVLIDCLEEQRSREEDQSTINEMTKSIEVLKKKRLPKDD